MTGLILKDYYSLRSYLFKQMGLMVVIYLFVSVAMKSFAFLAPMLTLSVMMMLVSSFSVDEASKWDSYALTMPITPRTIVASKYALFFGSLACISVVSAALCGILEKIVFKNGIVEIAISTGAVFVMYTVVTAIVLPLFFKLGAEKARIGMTIAFMIPFFGVVWGAQFLKGINFAALPWGVLGVGAAAALLVLFAGSYFLSVKIYEGKEY